MLTELLRKDLTTVGIISSELKIANSVLIPTSTSSSWTSIWRTPLLHEKGAK